MVGRTEGRRADELRALEARPRHVVDREVEVLRTRLRVGGDAPVPRVADRIQRISRRQVHDVSGRAGELGHLEDAVHGLALHDRRTREAVVHRIGLPLLEVLPDQDVDGPAVLGVHHDQRAGVGRALHRLEDRRVIQHEHAWVRHEELEGRDAFADEGVHLLQDLVVHLPHDHVEAVVRVRLLRLLVPAVEPGAQALSVVLEREVDDGRGPAERSRPRPRGEVVRAEAPAEGEVHVGVDVDRAGHHVPAGGVDRPVGLDGHARPDRRHLLPVHEDVGRDRLGRRDQRSPLDQRLHGSPFSSRSLGKQLVSSP